MTKKNPKISIITPNYNNSKYLEETIKSVLEQNYNNLEYIIIDGGSTDDSVNIIKQYEKDIHYWISEKDLGQSDAINKGIKQANGDIIAWLNSDDTHTPNTLNTIASTFQQHNSDLVYGNVKMFGKGKDSIYINPIYEVKDFFSRVSIHQPGVFWKRHLHNQLGYLDTRLHYCFDYDFWMRIFPNNNFKIEKIEETLANFRLHDDSKTISNPKQLYLDYRQVLCRFFNSLPENQNIIKSLKKIGIYENNNNATYNSEYKLNKKELEDIFNIYIDNVIKQEYSFGNLINTNKIIFSSKKTIKRNLLTLLKNNLMIKKITIVR